MRAAGYAGSAGQEDGAPTEEWLVVVLDTSGYVRENAGQQSRLATGPPDERLDRLRVDHGLVLRAGRHIQRGQRHDFLFQFT